MKVQKEYTPIINLFSIRMKGKKEYPEVQGGQVPAASASKKAGGNSAIILNRMGLKPREVNSPVLNSSEKTGG